MLAHFDDRLANGIAEGMNSVIESAKRVALGYRSLEYFSTMIYLKLERAAPGRAGLCYPLETAKNRFKGVR